MSVDPKTVEVGKHYVKKGGQMRKVLEIANDDVTYASESARTIKKTWSQHQTAKLDTFAHDVDREVDAHYNPDYQQ